MSDKLSVQVWGLSANAEGLWAIAATIIIVGIVAVVVGRWSEGQVRERTKGTKRVR